MPTFVDNPAKEIVPLVKPWHRWSAFLNGKLVYQGNGRGNDLPTEADRVLLEENVQENYMPTNKWYIREEYLKSK